MTGRPDYTGTPSGEKKPAARDTSRVLRTPMGGGITGRPKRGGQSHGARVEALLHDVFRLVRYLEVFIKVLLHTRLLGEENRQLLGHTARQ